MLKVKKITDNITLYTGTSLVNSTLIEDENFLIVVDTMLLPKDSKELADFIHKKNKPVKYILNTHWHSDHCYGNRFIKEKNTIIIAHKNFMQTIKAERNVLYSGRESFIKSENLIFPDITFSEELILEKEKIHFIYSPGHSFDSSIVYLPENEIIITGDNVLNSNNNKIAIPYFFWGNPKIMLQSLQKIVDLKPRIIIPGHGDITDLDKVKTDILYLKNIIKEYEKMAKDNQSKKKSNLSESELIPNTTQENFWVHKMHTMNLEKMNEMYNLKNKNL